MAIEGAPARVRVRELVPEPPLAGGRDPGERQLWQGLSPGGWGSATGRS
jgi:hypothetical protein